MIDSPRIALAFMTRLPLRHDGELTAAGLSRAAVWFPAVGLLVGAVVVGTHAVADWLTTGTVATVVAIAAAVILTGGLHEDGLADTADALGAPTTRERRLEILHDPRLGTYGTLALILTVAFSIAALAPLDHNNFARIVLVAHVLARWSTLPQTLVLGPARSTGAGALVRPSSCVVGAGTLFAVGACVIIAGGRPAAIAFLLAAAITSAGGYTAHRTFGGVTGDTLGAVNKLVEVATYGTLGALL